MATIKPIASRTLWYTALSTLAVVITYLSTDESFNTLIGTTGMLVLFILDKGITAYLRTITTKPLKREKKNNLDILNDESQADDDYTKDF